MTSIKETGPCKKYCVSQQKWVSYEPLSGEETDAWMLRYDQRAEQLAGEIASQARTAEDLNGLMRLMMKSALERMLNTEMDVHLGRKALSVER